VRTPIEADADSLDRATLFRPKNGHHPELSETRFQLSSSLTELTDTGGVDQVDTAREHKEGPSNGGKTANRAPAEVL